MWAMIIAKTAKYLAWAKNSLRKVSLNVVAEGFFSERNTSVCMEHAQSLHRCRRGDGVALPHQTPLAGPAWPGSGEPAQLAAMEANATVVQEQH